MGNGSAETWGGYIRRLTQRNGWSVARLAREAGFNPATLFEWMKGGGGESVKAGSIVAIAKATGEDPMIGFRAAAGLTPADPEDREIADVLAADDIDDVYKEDIIAWILERREYDRVRREADARKMINAYKQNVA
jgi:transcriptional regulator with XRE-family HTH domain